MTLPAPLVAAISAADGRVALVIGAGTSVELPTGIQASRDLSVDAYRSLIRQGILAEGDCREPEDLAKLADVVVAKTHGRGALVRSLPIDQFRTGNPNRGHLIAAALLREQALSAIVTLNFDLTLPSAVGRVGGGGEISIIKGPEDQARLGVRTVIFLHRNAYANEEQWILTTEDLATAWRDGWVDAIAARVLSGPVTVFAGIGTRVYSLVESASQLRRKIPGGCVLYNVDIAPQGESEFFRALGLGDDAYLQRGWCDFMERLSAILVEQHADELTAIARARGEAFGVSAANVAGLCRQLKESGFLDMAQVRARWLMSRNEYDPRRGNDPAYMADIIVAIEIIQRATGRVPVIREDGVVDFCDGPRVVASTLVASGRGLRGTIAVEAELQVRAATWRKHSPRPGYAVLAGVVQGHEHDIAAPADLARDLRKHDIIDAQTRLRLITFAEIVANPALAGEMLA